MAAKGTWDEGGGIHCVEQKEQRLTVVQMLHDVAMFLHPRTLRQRLIHIGYLMLMIQGSSFD